MKRIYVGNIGFNISEEGLRSEFEAYGHVKAVNICWNFATIVMANDVAAERAISDLNRHTAWVVREMPAFSPRTVAA